MGSLPKILTARRPARHEHMRIFGPRATVDPSRESIGDCSNIFTAYGNPSMSFFAEHAFPVLHATSGNPRERF